MKKLPLPTLNQPTETSGTFSATLTESEFANFKAVKVRFWLDIPWGEIYPDRWILNGSTQEENNVRTTMALTFNTDVPEGIHNLGGDDAKVRVSYTRFIRPDSGIGIMEGYKVIKGTAKFVFDEKQGHLQGTLADCTVQSETDPKITFNLQGEFDVKGFDFLRS
jgi:hypothetical protein